MVLLTLALALLMMLMLLLLLLLLLRIHPESRLYQNEKRKVGYDGNVDEVKYYDVRSTGSR